VPRQTLGSEPTFDGLTQPENEEVRFWERTLTALLSGGATQDEAIDGANLLLAAYRRKRGEAFSREGMPTDEALLVDQEVEPGARQSGLRTKVRE
jgi:hypothetical protein